MLKNIENLLSIWMFRIPLYGSILSKSTNLPAGIFHGVGIEIIQLRFSHTYNSIKVFPWKSGRIEYERERLAGISITHKTPEQKTHKCMHKQKTMHMEKKTILWHTN